MTIGINVGRRWKSLHGGIYSGAFFAISIFSSTGAHAVSDSVKSACRNDYFQHCSQFMVGSDELRQCMRSVGEDLSTPCLVALVQEGEITKADVERHNAAKAEPAKKRSGAVASDEPRASDAVTARSNKKHATKAAKTRKPGKSGTKAKAKGGTEAEIEADKAPTKRMGKKATGAQATAVTAPTVSKTKTHSKKKKHAKSNAATAKTATSKTATSKTATSKTATSKTATSKTGTKKTSTVAAAKAKKTAKKKATTKPADAAAP